MEDYRIPDQYLTASSQLDTYAAASQGRLNNEGFAWQPSYEDEHPYLQVRQVECMQT